MYGSLPLKPNRKLRPLLYMYKGFRRPHALVKFVTIASAVIELAGSDRQADRSPAQKRTLIRGGVSIKS